MTTNQLKAKELEEQERANKTRERETERSNRETEREKRRSNKANEQLTHRGQNMKAVGDVTTGLIKGAGALIGAANDPSWYNQDKRLVDDAASISFETPIHSKEKCCNGQVQTHPQVFSITYYPVLPQGYASGGGLGGNYVNAGIMQSAYNMYAWIRQANSGGRNYEAVDLLQYTLAISSLYSMIGFGIRGYAAARSFSSYNRNMGRSISRAVGIDFDDWNANLADVRLFINTAILRLSNFCVPNTMSYYLRQIWLTSNVFKDAKIKRSALLAFRPLVAYEFDSGANALLKHVDISTAFTVASYKALIDQLFNKLNNDDDIAIISGDIRKAYGDKLFHFEQFPEDLTLTPVYSEEVLGQINNGTIFGTLDDLTALDLKQSGGNVLYYSAAMTHSINTPNMPVTEWANSGQHLEVVNPRVNVLWEDVTPSDVMVATRLITTYGAHGISDGSGSKLQRYVRFCGTEVLEGIYGFDTSGNGVTELQATNREFLVYYSTPWDNIVDSTIGPLFDQEAALSVFDWIPYHGATIIGIPGGAATIAKVYNCIELGDREQYTYIQEQVVENLHNVAAMAMFGVPYVGTQLRK